MDDFQQAAAAARRRHTEAAWAMLGSRAQAEAIYTELRRIDAAQATGAHGSRADVAETVETMVPVLAD